MRKVYQCDEDDNEDDKDRTLSFHDYDEMMNTDSVGGDGDDGVDDDDDDGNPVLWFPAIACRPFAKLLSHQATGGDEDYLHRNDSNFDHTFYEFDDVEDDKDGDKYYPIKKSGLLSDSSPHVY